MSQANPPTSGQFTLNTSGQVATNLSTAGNLTITAPLTGAAGGAAIYPTYHSTYQSNYPIYNNSTSAISVFDGNNKEIVKMSKDGVVTWSEGINVDEAAAAFARSMRLGMEQAAGITQSVKLEMRDSVFNDLIQIAKQKGSLTAEDLTYMLEASKIVEKLKTVK